MGFGSLGEQRYQRLLHRCALVHVNDFLGTDMEQWGNLCVGGEFQTAGVSASVHRGRVLKHFELLVLWRDGHFQIQKQCDSAKSSAKSSAS